MGVSDRHMWTRSEREGHLLVHITRKDEERSDSEAWNPQFTFPLCLLFLLFSSSGGQGRIWGPTVQFHQQRGKKECNMRVYTHTHTPIVFGRFIQHIGAIGCKGTLPPKEEGEHTHGSCRNCAEPEIDYFLLRLHILQNTLTSVWEAQTYVIWYLRWPQILRPIKISMVKHSLFSGGTFWWMAKASGICGRKS